MCVCVCLCVFLCVRASAYACLCKCRVCKFYCIHIYVIHTCVVNYSMCALHNIYCPLAEQLLTIILRAAVVGLGWLVVAGDGSWALSRCWIIRSVIRFITLSRSLRIIWIYHYYLRKKKNNTKSKRLKNPTLVISVAIAMNHIWTANLIRVIVCEDVLKVPRTTSATIVLCWMVWLIWTDYMVDEYGAARYSCTPWCLHPLLQNSRVKCCEHSMLSY